MHAMIRTRDHLVRELKRDEKLELQIELDPRGFLSIFEFDRGVRELVLTTPGACKINVVK